MSATQGGWQSTLRRNKSQLAIVEMGHSRRFRARAQCRLSEQVRTLTVSGSIAGQLAPYRTYILLPIAISDPARS